MQFQLAPQHLPISALSKRQEICANCKILRHEEAQQQWQQEVEDEDEAGEKERRQLNNCWPRIGIGRGIGHTRAAHSLKIIT